MKLKKNYSYTTISKRSTLVRTCKYRTFPVVYFDGAKFSSIRNRRFLDRRRWVQQILQHRLDGKVNNEDVGI